MTVSPVSPGTDVRDQSLVPWPGGLRSLNPAHSSSLQGALHELEAGGPRPRRRHVLPPSPSWVPGSPPAPVPGRRSRATSRSAGWPRPQYQTNNEVDTARRRWRRPLRGRDVHLGPRAACNLLDRPAVPRRLQLGTGAATAFTVRSTAGPGAGALRRRQDPVRRRRLHDRQRRLPAPARRRRDLQRRPPHGLQRRPRTHASRPCCAPGRPSTWAGDFTTMGGRARTRLAAVNATTGALAHRLHRRPRRPAGVLAVDTSLRRLLVGGAFTSVNALPNKAIAAARHDDRRAAAVGRAGRRELHVHRARDRRRRGCRHGLRHRARRPSGLLRGRLPRRVADGSVVWQDECAGAGQSLVLLKGRLYFGSHTHDCGRMVGGFIGPRFRDAFVWYRLNTLDPATGAFGHWQPNTNGAGTTVVGPHVLATDGTQLFAGGDFTTVNGSAQQGLTRFAPKGTDAAPATPPAPVAHSTGAGRVVVTVPGTWDRDNGVLAVRAAPPGRRPRRHGVASRGPSRSPSCASPTRRRRRVPPSATGCARPAGRRPPGPRGPPPSPSGTDAPQPFAATTLGTAPDAGGGSATPSTRLPPARSPTPPATAGRRP